MHQKVVMKFFIKVLLNPLHPKCIYKYSGNSTVTTFLTCTTSAIAPKFPKYQSSNFSILLWVCYWWALSFLKVVVFIFEHPGCGLHLGRNLKIRVWGANHYITMSILSYEQWKLVQGLRFEQEGDVSNPWCFQTLASLNFSNGFKELYMKSCKMVSYCSHQSLNLKMVSLRDGIQNNIFCEMCLALMSQKMGLKAFAKA